MWVYWQDERNDCWWVGYFDPVLNRWLSRQSFEDRQGARREVHYLNGGNF